MPDEKTGRLDEEFVVQMKGITKVYPNGVAANQGVDFNLRKGEIHALMGENGAGKSTLMKMLFGLEQPTSGEIWVNGEKLNLSSPSVAISHGIGMVHQHFMLVPSLTVAENMVLGMVPKKGLFIDHAKAVEITKEYAERFNLHVEPEAKVVDIPVGMKQKVEILKALVRGAKILILDEPTSGLDPVSRDDLLDLLRSLCEQDGVSILFSTHITSDLDACADDVTYLQNGTVAQSVSLAGFTAPWKKLTGPETALAPALRGALRGLRVHRGEFEALYPSDLPCPAGCREELADLQTVMVYLEREVETV